MQLTGRRANKEVEGQVKIQVEAAVAPGQPP
jgi:hypothetical protein